MVASEKKVVNARERLSQQNILDFFGEERRLETPFRFPCSILQGTKCLSRYLSLMLSVCKVF